MSQKIVKKIETAGKTRPGRPRGEDTDRVILEAALRLVSTRGFRNVTVDQIAAEAGVGKMTLYRRWPNKAALVMDALLVLVGPRTQFPEAERALDSLESQLFLQARFFSSDYGRLIRSLIAEAQSDMELAVAFRERWIEPRREGVIQTLRKAVAQGELRTKIDFQLATDMLYGPLYYRLLLGTGTIDRAFVRRLLAQFLEGHRPA
ncbi:TetR/AcrR family transcriptional regulator [Silvibacterium acidisoli]|uniref:TetR/AcrR family transcriptional regulator n=1 Tax=Acidobacteriaceae bacterium ZG23-2 TaxID=2883246 RepID=UPI00406C8F09